MTDEERRIISAFVERMSGAAAQQQARPASPWGGSVPASGAQPQQPPLPPIDPEADALIADLFQRHPEARYRITQTAFVQEHALVEAQNRIQQLEWELEAARREAQAGATQNRGGLFGGMFGGGAAARPAPMPPRPRPQFPPGYNPGAMQQAAARSGGSGFLGTAITTAAGVAGGMFLGSMLMSAFSGGGAAEAAEAGAGAFGQEAVPASSPWTDPAGADAARYDQQDAYPADDAAAYDEGGFDDGGDFGDDI